eukprot:403351978
MPNFLQKNGVYLIKLPKRVFQDLNNIMSKDEFGFKGYQIDIGDLVFDTESQKCKINVCTGLSDDQVHVLDISYADSLTSKNSNRTQSKVLLRETITEAPLFGSSSFDSNNKLQALTLVDNQMMAVPNLQESLLLNQQLKLQNRLYMQSVFSMHDEDVTLKSLTQADSKLANFQSEIEYDENSTQNDDAKSQISQLAAISQGTQDQVNVLEKVKIIEPKVKSFEEMIAKVRIAPVAHPLSFLKESKVQQTHLNEKQSRFSMQPSQMRELLLKLLRSNKKMSFRQIQRLFDNPERPLRQVLKELCDYDRNSNLYSLKPCYI